jgi:MSHA biogenesis protein MshJ
MDASLRSLQTGLVAPEKMIPLLQQLLRGHDRLRLQSMKTLPVTGISEWGHAPGREGRDVPPVASGQQAPGTMAPTAAHGVDTSVLKPDELIYRHGVEIVVQGGYADLVAYMTELEALPTHLYWGQARLATGVYPEATLTLTLYTMSLDQKWMTL